MFDFWNCLFFWFLAKLWPIIILHRSLFLEKWRWMEYMLTHVFSQFIYSQSLEFFLWGHLKWDSFSKRSTLLKSFWRQTVPTSRSCGGNTLLHSSSHPGWSAGCKTLWFMCIFNICFWSQTDFSLNSSRLKWSLFNSL